MFKAFSFLGEVWEELGKVTWPTKQEAIRMTITVIVVSVIIAAFIGGLDYVLINIVGKLIGS